MTNRKDVKTWLRIGFFTTLLVVILGYSAFQARKIVEGPEIKITSPVQLGGSVSEPLVKLAGIATNIKEISLNGSPIYIDEQGNFNERLVLLRGYNIIKLEAKDKFNKETKKVIELNLN